MRFIRLFFVPFYVVTAVALAALKLNSLNAQKAKVDSSSLNSPSLKVQTVLPAAKALALEPLTKEEIEVQSLLMSDTEHITAPQNLQGGAGRELR